MAHAYAQTKKNLIDADSAQPRLFSQTIPNFKKALHEGFVQNVTQQIYKNILTLMITQLAKGMPKCF